MKDYSQIGQSIFARIIQPNAGFVVEIGSNSPTAESNSKALLEDEWRGWGIDSTDYFDEWRKSEELGLYEFTYADAIEYHYGWLSPLRSGFAPKVDYLSADIDDGTFDALKRFFDTAKGCRPVCATVEHDAYKLGDSLRRPQRKLMGELGYVLVGNNLWNYEDWWVYQDHPLTGRLAIALSPFGDEDNNDVEAIPDFKDSLIRIYEEIHGPR